MKQVTTTNEMSKTKRIFTICMLLLLLGSAKSYAQYLYGTLAHPSGPRISIRGGYDVWQNYNNNTPYIDYKGGVALGASFNYYWNWIGIGADVDYIKNKPYSIYPTDSLFAPTGARINNFVKQEDKITRIFYGLGPSFKYQKNGKFFTELYLRGGLANIKGGKTSLTGNIGGVPTLLNFHGGYAAKSVPTAKVQLQATYNLSPNVGLLAGAYYMHHFKVPELVYPGTGMSTGYIPFAVGTTGNTFINQGKYVGHEPNPHDIKSIGLFAGITVGFGGKRKPAPCNVCGCTITVTARDKFTKEVLANTDVVLTNERGEIVQSGTTNSFGTVVFKEVQTGNYAVKGKLYNVALESNAITAVEFNKCKETGGIQKEILYTDDNFILKGQVVVCNTATPLDGVSVVLKNNNVAEQKSTNTDVKGQFIFHALQNASYSIYGKKNNFFSQTETVSTSDFDRNKTLFIKLEVCMEKADCGTAIRLKNIHYDLDKYFIRDDAKQELNRLVQFMKDNPGVRVELSSHTDSRNTDAYNMTLSENRAKAAVDYIVSQGVDRSRLIGKGYGESRLLNKCADGVPCSEAEHQLNRRTEMKVICPDSK